MMEQLISGILAIPDDIKRIFTKINIILPLLPLLAFVHHQSGLWIIIVSTISLAIAWIYLHIIFTFKDKVLEKTGIKVIPYPKFLVLTVLVFLIITMYALYLSIKNFSYEDLFNLVLLLLIVFQFTAEIFSIFVFAYYNKQHFKDK